ncbi:LAGLIDADG family homing endonuclease [Patescibacteria group bacterium]|nr:LAGLIDADG family homing endonuclease [Patescibacteria group bacterium]
MRHVLRGRQILFARQSAGKMLKRFMLKKVPLKIGYYISGFVDGEGSFNVSLRKKSDYKNNWQVVLSFNVSQKDITLLNLIKKTLDCGIIKQRKIDKLYSLDITNPFDIANKVIPFFDKFKLISKSKQKNYLIFKKIVDLMIKKEHLNEKGLYKIMILREKLNIGASRKRKYSINDVFGKSSETICQNRNLPTGITI